jgi:hypothetical protein
VFGVKPDRRGVNIESMSLFLLIVAVGVTASFAFVAARVISAARFEHALRAEAPTAEDVAAVISDAEEARRPSARTGTPQRIGLARRPGEFRRRTA